MEDCIFCKIVKGEIPAEIIYEDDRVLVFLNIRPTNFGHTLVIPKEHFKNILDTPDEILLNLMKVVKKIGTKVQESLGAKGFNVGINNGEVAGQIIFHIHIHVIPRYTEDDLKMWPNKEITKEELKDLAKKLRIE